MLFEEAAGVRVLTVATDMEVTFAAQAPQLQGQNADVEEGAKSSSQAAQGNPTPTTSYGTKR